MKYTSQLIAFGTGGFGASKGFRDFRNGVRSLMFGCLCLTAVWGLPGHALEWQELSTLQKKVLSPQQQRWESLSEAQQQRLAKGAQRWLDMDPDQRKAMSERFKRWNSLSPEKKVELTRRLDAYRKLTPEQQRQLQDRMQRFNQLPKKQQQQLRDRFKNLSPQDRAKALDRMKRRAVMQQRLKRHRKDFRRHD